MSKNFLTVSIFLTAPNGELTINEERLAHSSLTAQASLKVP